MGQSTLIAIVFVVGSAAALAPGVVRMRRRIWDALGRAAGSRAIAPILVASVSLLVAAMPQLLKPWPVPNIHDEFAYLLAADTFAHGRLANEPHKLWRHFETFHVIQQPTYAAKFPPGQGMSLALGQVLFDRPLVGAWITIALATLATWWAARAVLPKRWALLAGLMAATMPVVQWWTQCYWGGGVAMLGGALLLGAMAHAARGGRVSHGVIAGFGIALLANSRPFEGLILTILTSIVFASARVVRARFSRMIGRVALPAGAIVLATGAGMMYYNGRVTHDPMVPPYALHAQQYMAAPLLYGQPIPPTPDYRHELLRRFHAQIELQEYLRQTTLDGFLAGLSEKATTLRREYIRPNTNAIPLIVAGIVALAPRAMRAHRATSRWARAGLILVLGVPIVHVLCTPWLRVHYMAPIVCPLVVLTQLGLRQIARWRTYGWAIVVGLTAAHVAGAALWMTRPARGPDDPIEPGEARAELIRSFDDRPGKHLIILRYGPATSPQWELVYNGGDIDASRIIFAREIDPNGDSGLFEYYDDRFIWLLDLGRPPDELPLLRPPVR